MGDDYGMDDVLVGLTCTSVTKAEYSWHLGFGESASLDLECPWRLVVEGAIAYGADDHEQRFGLPAPIDGEERIRNILSTSPITKVELRPGTADLTLIFDNGVRLEAFNSSCGYEGWNLSGKEALGFLVVAQGGGNLEVFIEGATKSRSGLSSRYVGSAERK
jgi:hypothetical protein